MALSDKVKEHLKGMLETNYDWARDYAQTRSEFKEWCQNIDAIAEANEIELSITKEAMEWWDARCPDCGADDSKRGDHPCPFPGGDPS